jgi:peptidoglycan/LPS O-acetylase OafA/YrhL
MNDDTVPRPEDFDGHTAAKDLDAARSMSARARREGSRWVRLYLFLWAGASIALVIALGLGDRVVDVISMILWAGLAIMGGLWSRSKGIRSRGMGRRLGAAAGLWAAFFGIAIAAGVGSETDSAPFWVLAALFTAVPLLVAAVAPTSKADHAG